MELDATDVRSLNSNSRMKGYFEDDEEGFLYVREFETHRLNAEFEFVLRLLDEFASEIRHRDRQTNFNPDTVIDGKRIDLAYQIKETLNKYDFYE